MELQIRVAGEEGSNGMALESMLLRDPPATIFSFGLQVCRG